MPLRSKAPKIQEINSLSIPLPTIYRLDNGIPVYILNMGTQEVVKLEAVFWAGRPYERQPLVARACAQLLKEGTHRHSSASIAEQIDFYGGSFSTPIDLDTTNFVLYSLHKHFDQLLPLFAEILCQPTFPEEELITYRQNNQQRLQVELSKNDVIAYRKITELIFGQKHPYGYNSFPETYDQLRRSDLIEHHQRCYVDGNCALFVSGRVNDAIIRQINQQLGQQMPKGTRAEASFPKVEAKPERWRKQNPNSVQTAIRIGRRLFNRKHPDYPAFFVLNNIFGGYFGSRLMANIRENKGYTYNIFSTTDSMHEDGYFYIGTEVGNDFVNLTLEEIYKEMKQLRETLVSKEELKMVRNYLLGTLLTTLDGPFNIADLVRKYTLRDIPFAAFDELVETIKNIDPHQLQALAIKYLDAEEMWEVVVGA